MGVDAEMSPRHHVYSGFGSFGTIDIKDSPIRWVNIRRIVESKGYSQYGPRNRAGKSRLSRGIWAVKPT